MPDPPPEGVKEAWGGPALDRVCPQGRAVPDPPPEGVKEAWGGPALPSERVLPGDLAIWIVILVEMATFALLFLSCAVARALDVEAFDAGQRTLDATKGVVNTWLLIGGSGCVVAAIRAARAERVPSGVRWLLAAQGCGLAFIALKSLEYREKFASGADLDTDTFHTFYFLLTGFHFFHVLAAVVFLGLLTLQLHRLGGRASLHALETGAAFWHMVDLLWIVLFPLLYLIR